MNCSSLHNKLIVLFQGISQFEVTSYFFRFASDFCSRATLNITSSVTNSKATPHDPNFCSCSADMKFTYCLFTLGFVTTADPSWRIARH